MTNPIFRQFIIILPEVMLTLLALLTQLSALLFTNKSKIITNITLLLLTILLFISFFISQNEVVGFNNSFYSDNIIKTYKCLILFFLIISIIIYNGYCKVTDRQFRTEFITLILLSTVGIFIAISSRNFLLLFCSIELQALVAYALAGFGSNNLKSSEGALKYFLLGALVSCLSLFGISFIYGFAGSLDYSDISEKLNNSSSQNIGLIIGLVLLLTSMLFKLSAAPLHSWAPDVYEGSSVPAVTYFATTMKIANVIILLNIVTMVVGEYTKISVDLIKIAASLSMVIGASGAIRQNSLKRLMGYATILNIGYVLMAIALHSDSGNWSAIIYIVIYTIGVAGFFACLISLLGKKSDLATFDDLKGVASNRKALAAGISVIVFSMIGIPPLAGFFGKYYLFYQAIIERQYIMALIAITTTIIAAYYYLKIIKYMYFIEADNELESRNTIVTSQYTSQGLKFVSCLMIAMLLLSPFLLSNYLFR
jgi:NADH-quinone oxidoreductase subunit N